VSESCEFENFLCEWEHCGILLANTFTKKCCGLGHTNTNTKRFCKSVKLSTSLVSTRVEGTV
jgi:hypothetical protein